MAKIQEYTQEVDAPGPSHNTSPNLEALGAAGSAAAQAGSEIGQASRMVYERQRQAETSDIYATMADKRAEMLDDVQTQVSQGTFDAEKFKNDYQEWAEKQSDQYQTPDGKNYFARQSARLQGTLLVKAGRAQAVQQANQAKADLTDGLNSYGAAVENDPGQFQDALDANMEHLHQLVSEGTVSAKDAPKFEQAMGTQLAQSALRGMIDQDPNEAEKALNSGQYDQYLNAAQRRQMKSEISQGQRAAEVEGVRQDSLAKKALAAKGEDWGQNYAFPKLIDGNLSAKDINKAPLTIEQKFQWLAKIEHESKLQNATDPRVKNELFRRSNLPSSDPDYIGDLPDALRMDGVTSKDIQEVTHMWDKTPQGQADRVSRKQLLKVAEAKLVGGNTLAGIKDPDGQYHLSQFTSALVAAEQKAKQEGTPYADLHNPNSKNYFGNNIAQYQRSATDIFAAITKPTVPAQNIDTTPGIKPNAAEANKYPTDAIYQTKGGVTRVYDRKTRKLLGTK